MNSTHRLPLVAAAAAALLSAAPSPAAEGARSGAAGAKAEGPIALAVPADLPAAVAAIEKATGAKAGKPRFGDVPAAEGRSFAVDPRVAERLLTGSHAAFRKAGLYLFRYERSFGLAGEKDQLAVLRAADYRAVVRRVGTGQAHHGLTSDQVVAWLDDLAREEPFELWEVGTDYVAGRFERTPKDPVAVARRCAEIAPDLVAGRASTLDLLAAEIRQNRTLYLIW